MTFWNLSDRDSWLGAANYALPFDDKYQPKMAYTYILEMKDPAWDMPKRPARRFRPGQGQGRRGRGEGGQFRPGQGRPEGGWQRPDGQRRPNREGGQGRQ